jgi:hypothetical protein
MAFQPSVNQALTIDMVGYLVAEHPARRGEPYGIAGQQGMVYQLVAASPLPDDQAHLRRRALKVCPPEVQSPELMAQAERLAAVAGVPGLAAARRVVLDPQRHWNVLRRNPDLMYAIVMPWIDGPTWAEVAQARRPLAREQSGALAYALAKALAALEQRGLAHGNLAGPNLLLPGLVEGAPASATPLELVDFEDLYAAAAERPEQLPTGSPGYAHATALQGLWQPEMDRFAGAVLLAELLGWCDAEVRASAWGASYFDPRELQQSTARYRVLTRALREHWGERVGWFFERAWLSATVAECAPLAEWLAQVPAPAPAPPAVAAPPGAPTPPAGMVRPPVGMVRPPAGAHPLAPPAPPAGPAAVETAPPPAGASPTPPAPAASTTPPAPETPAATPPADAPPAPSPLATVPGTPAPPAAEAATPAAAPAAPAPAAPAHTAPEPPPATTPAPPAGAATPAPPPIPRWPRPPVGPQPRPPAAPPPPGPSAEPATWPPAAEAPVPPAPAPAPAVEAVPSPPAAPAPTDSAAPAQPPVPTAPPPAPPVAAPPATPAAPASPPAVTAPPAAPAAPAPPPAAPAQPPPAPAPVSAPAVPPAPIEDWSPAPPVDEAASAARALLDLAERLESSGARAAALASYRWALALAPAGSDLARQLAARLAAWPGDG